MDEEVFSTHSDQLGHPTTVTQCLTFQGFSQQDTPPDVGNPAQVKPATIFSPNTLHKTIVGDPPQLTPSPQATPAPLAPEATPAPQATPAPPADQMKKE
jgi:hypothetical protein